MIWSQTEGTFFKTHVQILLKKLHFLDLNQMLRSQLSQKDGLNQKIGSDANRVARSFQPIFISLLPHPPQSLVVAQVRSH